MVFLAGQTFAIATYCVTTLITASPPLTEQFFFCFFFFDTVSFRIKGERVVQMNHQAPSLGSVGNFCQQPKV